MTKTESITNPAKKKNFLLIIVPILVLLGIFMTEFDQPEKISSGFRISCLSNPDPWTSLSYSCAEKETVIAATGSDIDVTAGGQGAIAVKTWNRNEIKIRVVSEAWAKSTETAEKILESINYKFEENRLFGVFPQSENAELPWAVSFEITVPANYNVNLSTVNGAIYVDELKGNISAKAINGAVYLTQIGGKVVGKSTNGRVEAKIIGGNWDGESLDVESDNGDVAVFFPKDFSAQFNSITERGKIFVQDKTYSSNVFKKSLNEGGKPITARSENGNILVYY